MSLFEELLKGLPTHPKDVKSLEGQTREVMDRIRWAFNSDPDDDDAHIVNGALDYIDAYITMIRIDSKAGRSASGLIGESLRDLMESMAQVISELEAIAVVRVRSQGRWFTDADGPDSDLRNTNGNNN